MNKIDKNSCLDGANILSKMDLLQPPLSSSDSFECHFNNASNDNISLNFSFLAVGKKNSPFHIDVIHLDPFAEFPH